MQVEFEGFAPADIASEFHSLALAAVRSRSATHLLGVKALQKAKRLQMEKARGEVVGGH